MTHLKSHNIIVYRTVPRDTVGVVVWKSLVATILIHLNCGFLQLLCDNSGKVSQLGQRRILSKFLQVFISLILLPFRVVVFGAFKVPLKCSEPNRRLKGGWSKKDLFHLLQRKPKKCTLILSIFISTSLHISGNYVSIIRRTYFIYATLILFTV